MSTLTLISDFGQINEVEKFKFDVIDCLYNYVITYNKLQHAYSLGM